MPNHAKPSELYDGKRWKTAQAWETCTLLIIASYCSLRVRSDTMSNTTTAGSAQLSGSRSWGNIALIQWIVASPMFHLLWYQNFAFQYQCAIVHVVRPSNSKGIRFHSLDLHALPPEIHNALAFLPWTHWDSGWPEKIFENEEYFKKTTETWNMCYKKIYDAKMNKKWIKNI